MLKKHIYLIVLLLQIPFIFGCGHSSGNHNPITAIEEKTQEIIQPASNSYIFDLSKNVSIKLIKIPAGSFIMGSPESEPGHLDDETMHEVKISNDFYLGIYEVTQAQYESVVGFNPSYYRNNTDSPLKPVETIPYNDAKNFCNLMNTKIASESLPIGYYFDLPTEAQWEYACRAGTTTGLNNDTDILESEIDDKSSATDLLAWYFYNSKNDGENMTHTVGLKNPNAWGLYDMHGNVLEWCKDWYGDYPNAALSDPKGPNIGTYRVVRGGSWRNNPFFCRSAFRGNVIPTDAFYSLGFRLALVKK